MAKGRVGSGKGVLRGLLLPSQQLCALNLTEPCPTYRPDHPDGLRPPRQMRLVFRQERRAMAAWAFPSAAEQAALHSS